MYEFRMPKLGADMDDGTLIEWKVSVGDVIEKGDIVAEVETSKGMIDIEVFVSGTVKTLIARPGDIIPVGRPIALLQANNNASATESVAEKTVATSAPPKRRAKGVSAPASGDSTAVAQRVGTAHEKVSPRARRLAQQLKVDLTHIVGSGPHGSVVAADIQRADESTGEGTSPASGNKVAMRLAISRAMSRAKREIPHYYLSHDIDVSDLLVTVETNNKRIGVTARWLPSLLFYKAIAVAASEFEAVNGTYENGEFAASRAVNLGVAISLRGGGLLAPCLMDAANKPATDLMRDLKDLVKRTRSGGLRSSELSSGTITVSNLGDRGVDRLAAVIYPPQVALVGIGRVRERPWAVDGAIKLRRIATFSLAADHRVSDGHTGALFLRRVETLIMHPDNLMKEK